MATRQIITNKGLELLASASSFEGQSYWLGYFAPAYIPNFWKEPTEDLDIVGGDGGDISGDGHPSVPNTSLEGPYVIGVTDRDILNTNMTKLTKFGDIIWNIFQGDLTGAGFADGISDGSPGGDLFGLTMYSSNIKKHYRYVIDGDGNNNLLVWKIDSNNNRKMLEAHRYYGTDGFTGSTMPIPAPLYYFGDVSRDNGEGPYDTNLYLNDFLSNTGSDQYPVIRVNVDIPPVSEYEIPRVSIDYRGYNNFDTTPPIPNLSGTYFNDGALASDTFNNVNAWYYSDSTIFSGVFNSSSTGPVTPPKYLNRFHMLLGVSNYNRYHSPVSADGTILSSDLKNRNMAKVSKLFPISDYSVLNSQRGLTSNGEQREVATGLTLSIDINLKPLAKTSGYTDGIYNENSDLTLQNRYDRGILNTDPLFNKSTTSFKFNRLGIYAVPLRKAPNSTVPIVPGQDLKFEVEIDPDSEPVLFAVVDWDNAVILSDSGDGAYQFKAQINVNLESPDGVNETPLVRDTAVFFNLYNESSINWYKNQLLANASTQHAVMELQQQVNSIRERNTREFTPVQQIIQSSQSSTGGLINLSDAGIKANGGLKGINSFPENAILPETGDIYKLGLNSITLGNGTSAEHDNSIVTGLNNHIIKGGSSSSIIGGEHNIIKIYADNSIIIGGQDNIIWDSSRGSGIFSATNSQIHDDNTNAVILGGKDNHIYTDRSATIGGEGLNTNTENQVVMGSYNDVSGPDNNTHLVIGNGTSILPSSAFEFITKTGTDIPGKTTINIKNLATNNDTYALRSGDIYVDYNTSPNTLRIMP